MRHFTIKVLGLWSFAGGPLYCADFLKQTMPTSYAFALAFAPVGLMILAALTVTEEAPTRITRWIALLGLAGTLILLVMNAHVAGRLVSGASCANTGLVISGIVAGIAASTLLVHVSLRHLRDGRRRTPPEGVDRRAKERSAQS